MLTHAPLLAQTHVCARRVDVLQQSGVVHASTWACGVGMCACALTFVSREYMFVHTDAFAYAALPRASRPALNAR